MDLENIGLYAVNLKPFGPMPQGFSEFKKINLIIGKNNSGKSALVDLVFLACNYGSISKKSFFHKDTPTSLRIVKNVTEAEIKNSFSSSSGHHGASPNDQGYAMKYCGEKISLELTAGTRKIIPEQTNIFNDLNQSGRAWFLESLSGQIINPFQNLKFFRLSAERDINPEKENNEPSLSDDGRGATSLIYALYNLSTLVDRAIREKIKNDFNTILFPDIQISDIEPIKDSNTGDIEVYLYEDKKHTRSIPLSSSGSGIKTVLLVLLNLHLRTKILGVNPKDVIFSFEELENNLHPSVQRKLYSFLDEYAQKTGSMFIITTHSSVGIDLFSANKDAQLLRVSHNGQESFVENIESYGEKLSILNELGFKASDILQSNGVVWVEGPSDRIYINKWISLLSEGKLKEGLNYQCMHYGGALKSHLSSLPPNEIEKEIAVLRINKNAFFVGDSDKISAEDKLNSTTERLITEFGDENCFVTSRAMIENYVSAEIANKAFGVSSLREIAEYEKGAEYLKYLSSVVGKGIDKIIFAEKITSVLTKDDILKNTELTERVNMMVGKIKSWNQIS